MEGSIVFTHIAVERLNSLFLVCNTPEEWLDGFNTFSIYQVLPQLIELWGLNVKTDVEAKKTSPN